MRLQECLSGIGSIIWPRVALEVETLRPLRTPYQISSVGRLVGYSLAGRVWSRKPCPEAVLVVITVEAGGFYDSRTLFSAVLRHIVVDDVIDKDAGC